MGKVIKNIAIGAVAGAITVGTFGAASPIFAVNLGAGVLTSVGIAGTAAAIGATAGAILAAGASALGAISKALAPKVDLGAEAAGRTEEIRSATAPRTIVYGTVRLAGTLVYATTHGTDNKYLSMVFVVAAHEIDSFQKWYLNDEAVTLDGSGFVTGGRFAGKVRITSHTGSATQAADAALAAEVGEWTTAHQLKGLAYYVVRFEFDPEVFVNGRPRVNAVIHGARLFDPRTSTTAWSDNWALVLRDYLTRDPLGCRIPAGDIDDASFIAAANIADELVTLKDSTTQKRYTADGVVNVTRPRESVIRDLLSAGAGQLIYQGGQFRLYAGAAVDAISVSLDEKDLRGPLTVQARVPRRELVNRVRGQYIDARSDLYQAADYPAVTNAAYEAQDGGDVLELDLDLPFTTEGRRAQRIAKIALEDARRQMTVQFPAKLKGLQVQAWSVVRVTNARFGWTNKEFRVIGWQLSPDGGVDLALKEYDANIYAWNATSDEQTLAAPAIPTLQDGTQAPSVAGLSVAPLTFAQNGAKVPGLQATWTAPEKVVAATEVQFKRTADPDWKPVPPVIDPQNPRVLLSGLLPGESIDVRVRHKTGFGKFGAWAVSTANTPPANSYIATDVLTGAGKAVAEPGADVTANNTAADTTNVAGKPATTIKDQSDTWLDPRAAIDVAVAAGDAGKWVRVASIGTAGRGNWLVSGGLTGGNKQGSFMAFVGIDWSSNTTINLVYPGSNSGIARLRVMTDGGNPATVFVDVQLTSGLTGGATLRVGIVSTSGKFSSKPVADGTIDPSTTGLTETASIAIGNATSIFSGVYNDSTEFFEWLTAGGLRVKGNDTLTGGGDLASPVKQDQGNGTLRPLIIGRETLSVRDGVGVSFSTAYQNIPNVTFKSGGLSRSSTLNASQYQDFKADLLGTGGFTPKLRIKETAGTPTTVIENTNFAGGQPSGPAWQGDRASADSPFDDTYTFFMTIVGTDSVEPGDITLDLWTQRAGGSWVKRNTVAFVTGTSGQGNKNVTATVVDSQLVSGDKFGVSVASQTNASFVSFDKVEFEKATPAGDETATPAGVPDVIAEVTAG